MSKLWMVLRTWSSCEAFAFLLLHVNNTVPNTAIAVNAKVMRINASTQPQLRWVLALILIILALTAVAVLGTVLLTRSNKKPKASQEDQVRSTIQSFDVAVQNGDLAKLRSITCGDIRNGYLNYDEHEWTDTYRRVATAKQYPVVASIDQVVVDDGHAEANVTAFMAYAPQIRSTRSFDLQYRDDQWKICQSNTD